MADDVRTAIELSRITGVKLSSLSSVLCRLSRPKGCLVRVPDFGPRGGYGYRRKLLDEIIAEHMSERIAQEIDREILQGLIG